MVKTKATRQRDFGKAEAGERMTAALRAALSMERVPHGTPPPSKRIKVKSRPKKGALKE
jgi:hypothetical protein